MGFSGPRSAGLTERITILGSSTKNSEEIDLADFKTVKYSIAFWNESEGKTKSMEFTVNNEGGNLIDTVHDRLGIGINLEVNTVINAGKMAIKIKNNETFSVEAELNFIILGES